MSDAVKRTHFILFVRDQESSRRFYERVLNQAASLDPDSHLLAFAQVRERSG